MYGKIARIEHFRISLSFPNAVHSRAILRLISALQCGYRNLTSVYDLDIAIDAINDSVTNFNVSVTVNVWRDFSFRLVLGSPLGQLCLTPQL